MTKEEDIKNAVECMRKGGVILYPTDTVWGIGCDATNPEAVKKVYEIKKRDDSKALICLIDSADRMARYFRNVPQVAWDFIDAAMPEDVAEEAKERGCTRAFVSMETGSGTWKAADLCH